MIINYPSMNFHENNAMFNKIEFLARQSSVVFQQRRIHKSSVSAKQRLIKA
jgi:hypothetical protein